MLDQTNDLVTQIIQAQATIEVLGYQQNLAFAQHAVLNGWLPGNDGPGIQQHLSTLRQYMTEIGHEENDDFLLGLGLTVPGVQRGIVPPLMVLDANRGGFVSRRQKEAAGQILQLRKALSIGRRFVSDLSPNTQQALAELAELSARRPVQSEVERLNCYSQMSSEEADQLAKRAIQFLESAEESIKTIGTQLLQHVACLRGSGISGECSQSLVENGVYWPSCVYRDSSDAVALQLISRIEDMSEQLELNHLLLALAWTRSAVAEQVFQLWTDHPPAWALKLHVPPKLYTHDAGWCLDEDGHRRDLISAHCFRLLAAEQPAERSLRCRTLIDNDCPSCKGPLGYLFDFSRIGDEYFPGEFVDAPRKVLCCFHCVCYEPVFTNYREFGTPKWLSPMEPREATFDGKLRSFGRKLDNSPFPPFACAEPSGLEDASTLGGIPMWLQDAEYPRCLECSRPMTFLAQHDNGPLREEGIYYAFFCALCHVGAVSYQQT